MGLAKLNPLRWLDRSRPPCGRPDLPQVYNRWHQKREKEESVKCQSENKTKGGVNGPKAHKKAICWSKGTTGRKAAKQPVALS